MNDKLKFYTYNFNKEHFTHRNVSTLHILSKLYMSFNMLNDRFNILNDDCEYNLCSRNENINDIWNLKLKTFEECCYERSTEIIRYANTKNLDIYVSYSGGVDSTTVVSSFLMNSSLDKNRFHVLYNKNSIEEYPYFFELLIKNEISLIDISFDIQNLIRISERGIIVSGLCGDQLVGSNLCTKCYKDVVDYFHDWNDALRICSSYSITDKHISDIESYIKYTGVDIKYFGEFSWLFNFCIKWTYVSEYMDSFTRNKYFAFFDTPHFSRYALFKMTQKEKYKQSGLYYKTDFKKLIYNYTKDEDYLLYKGKEANYIGDRIASPGFVIVTNNGSNIFKEDTDVVYKTLLHFIKEEYKEYFVVEKFS